MASSIPGQTSNTVRVGVSGHRFFARPDLIAAGVDRAVDKIEKSFPGRSLAVVSSLAEGADRLVANRVLNRKSAALIAVLPLAQEDYLTDFSSEQSKREFLELLRHAATVIDLPAKPSREQAYRAAGEAIIKQIDVLIAVWDGRAAQGPGGTGEIVARARARMIPLAWVHAGNRKPGTNIPVALGAEEGEVTYERF